MVKNMSVTQVCEKISNVVHFSGPSEFSFDQLHIDSRKIKAGDGFVACKGFKLDGRDFIDNAIELGASLIIAEKNDLNSELFSKYENSQITFLLAENLNESLSAIAALFYQQPSKKLHMIGVTGTNGKSSCVQMIAQALHLLDGCCWTMGTLGCGPFGAQRPNDNTTADAITVQRELARAIEYNCKNAAMEVSSHGIVLGRVNDVQFHTAIFTNLTRDHLDFHETMESYGDAKKQLLISPHLQWAIINVDDKFGRKLRKSNEITAKKIFISLNTPFEGADLNHWVWADNIRLTLKGIQALLFTPWGKYEINVPLVGRFNLYNLMSVVAALGVKLQDIDKVAEVVQQLLSVKGRMQLIRVTDKPLIIVDYAHTSDAIEQALNAAREHCNGKIVTVFGCGGDRDPGKRPLMARVAEKLSNKVIFTDDNPRTENPQKIVDEMRLGLKNPDRVEYISSRREAIEKAISLTTKDDLILVAGKGHEDYQIYGVEKHHFSDIDVARESLEGVHHD